MKKKPELRQLRQLRITEAIFLKKNLNYVNYVITPITQLQKRQNHPLVLPLVAREGQLDHFFLQKHHSINELSVKKQKTGQKTGKNSKKKMVFQPL